jgi:hypothetical protein
VAALHKKVFTSQKGLRSTGGPDFVERHLPHLARTLAD